MTNSKEKDLRPDHRPEVIPEITPGTMPGINIEEEGEEPDDAKEPLVPLD